MNQLGLYAPSPTSPGREPLTGGVDLDATLHRIVLTAVATVPGAARGALFTAEERDLVCRAAQGHGDAEIAALRAWLEGADDLGKELRWVAARDAAAIWGTGAVESARPLGVAPALIDGALVGYLVVELATPVLPDAGVQAVLSLFADAAAAVLSRRRMYLKKTRAALEIRLREEMFDGITAKTGLHDVTESVAHAFKLLLPQQRWGVVNLSMLGEGNQTLQVHEIAQRISDPYWGSARRGAYAAGRDLCVDVEFRLGSPSGDGSQTSLIDEAIGRGFDGIAVAPSDAVALEPAIRRARDAGVPLVTLDANPVDGSASLYHFGMDNYRGGQLAAEALARLLPNGGKVASLAGSSALYHAFERVLGFEDTFAGTSIVPVGRLEDGRIPGRGVQVAGELLAQHPDLAGVLGAWDENAPDWALAVENAGKRGQVKIVSFDMSVETCARLQDGSIHVVIMQRVAEMAYRCVQTLCRIAVEGVDAALARLPASRILKLGLDVVTLERTPWSIDLADHLTRKRWIARDPEIIESVARAGRRLRVMVIGMSWATKRAEVAESDAPYRPDTLVSHVIRTAAPLVVDTASPEHGALEDVAQARRSGLRTLVGVPLLSDGIAVGALIAGSERPRACSDADIALFQRISLAAVKATQTTQLMRTVTARAAELERAAERQRGLLKTVLDLSCPVLPVANGILVIPLIGAMSAERSENLLATALRATADHRAAVVLIDVTGIPSVDGEVMTHLLRTVAAVKLLGAAVALVGISASVARSVVELGLDVGAIAVCSDLQRGFAYALSKLGAQIVYQGRSAPAA